MEQSADGVLAALVSRQRVRQGLSTETTPEGLRRHVQPGEAIMQRDAMLAACVADLLLTHLG